MIRKVLLSTVAIVAISGTAFAADLPSRRAPPVYIPPPIPVFSWTGFYIGGDVGYAFGKDTATEVPAPRGKDVSFNVGQHNGIIGGGHIGYNFSTQSLPLLGGLAGGLGSGLGGLGFGGGSTGAVVGVEGDITGSDYRGTSNFPGIVGLNESTHSDVQGSVRGRVGVAVDRALFFVTGGAAFAEFVDNYSLTTTLVPGATVGNQQVSHDKLGWTVGGGMEYALTTNWSLRGEYRYTDFGHFTDVNGGGPLFPVAFNTIHRNIQQRATLGFSYKFESPMAAPVVARY